MGYYKNYMDNICQSIKRADEVLLTQAEHLIASTNEKGGKVIIAGNGGSSAIASHVSVDLAKSARIHAVSLNEPGMVTCFANDYGYEKYVEKAIEIYAGKDDVVIMISSSGRSKNIIYGALKSKALGLNLITLSGFSPNNDLRMLGDINFWVNSKAYNVIEMAHQLWLLAIVDKLAGVETTVDD